MSSSRLPYGAGLSPQDVQQFESDGYLVLPGFWGQSEVAKARGAMEGLLREGSSIWEAAERALVFTTKEQSRTSGDYFLESGGEVRIFWEEKARGPDGKFLTHIGDLRKAINKVGHALHDREDTFRELSYDPRIGKIARQLGTEKPLACQSMYIFKQPHIGGEVNNHQDGTFLRTDPQSVLGFWWALEECHLENGCLWALPGSHKKGIKRHFQRKEDNSSCEFVLEQGGEEAWDESTAVPLQVHPGTLVILHNAVAHFSRDNLSDKSRHAYSIHVIDGNCKYPKSNWLQRQEPFQEIPDLQLTLEPTG